MSKVKIRKIGNSLGVILPAEMLQKLNMREKDDVLVVEDPDGLKISPYDRDFERAMEIFEEGCGKYRNTLRKLAE